MVLGVSPEWKSTLSNLVEGLSTEVKAAAQKIPAEKEVVDTEHANRKKVRIIHTIANCNLNEFPDLCEDIDKLIAIFNDDYDDFCCKLVDLCFNYIIKTSKKDTARLKALLDSLIKMRQDIEIYFDTGDDLEFGDKSKVAKYIDKLIAETQGMLIGTEGK